jgi:hypothetical protein
MRIALIFGRGWLGGKRKVNRAQLGTPIYMCTMMTSLHWVSYYLTCRSGIDTTISDKLCNAETSMLIMLYIHLHKTTNTFTVAQSQPCIIPPLRNTTRISLRKRAIPRRPIFKPNVDVVRVLSGGFFGPASEEEGKNKHDNQHEHAN